MGGDYKKIADGSSALALTSDGGRSWTTPIPETLSGFRSAVAFIADRNFWISTGTSGSDISRDGGHSWTCFDQGNYNAISFVSSTAGWAVGPQGRIASFRYAGSSPK